MKKLGLVISAAAIAGFASAAFADQATPGDINKAIKESCGTPGQNALDLPANEFAKRRNEVRKAGNVLFCPIYLANDPS